MHNYAELWQWSCLQLSPPYLGFQSCYITGVVPWPLSHPLHWVTIIFMKKYSNRILQSKVIILLFTLIVSWQSPQYHSTHETTPSYLCLPSFAQIGVLKMFVCSFVSCRENAMKPHVHEGYPINNDCLIYFHELIVFVFVAMT